MIYSPDRVILHADLDKFYVSVAQAENSDLKNNYFKLYYEQLHVNWFIETTKE